VSPAGPAAVRPRGVRYRRCTYSAFMARVVLLLATVGVTIYAVIDCWQREERDIRNLPKPVWFIMIVMVPLIGGLCWLTLGRPRELDTDGIRVPRHSAAPDDDEDFLRSLNRRPRGDERRGKDDDSS
jgi:hypothetical protein